MIKEQILSLFSDSKQVSEIINSLDRSESVSVTGTPFSSRAFVLSSILKKYSKNILVILPDEKEAKLFFEDVSTIINRTNVEFFPQYNRQLWSELGPVSSLVGSRILTLKALRQQKPKLIVAPVGALLEKVSNPQLLGEKTIHIRTGSSHKFEELIENLVNNGYVREERVDRPGEMSVRGGLIDIFMYEDVHPYRIELFGDEVESIRKFDIETQRSINICPAVEIFPLGAGGLYGPFDDQPLDEIKLNSTVLDYLPAGSILCFNDYQSIEREIEDVQNDITFRMDSFINEHKIDSLSYNIFYSGYKALLQQTEKFKKFEFTVLNSTFGKRVDFGMISSPGFNGKFDLFKNEINSLNPSSTDQKNPQLFFCCDSLTQENRIKDLLAEEKFPDTVKTTVLNISEGFQWPSRGLYLYTNKELYSREKRPRPDWIEKRKVALRNLATIQIGDYVVHNDFGIGVFRGLKKISAYKKELECLILEYQDNDILYVPLEKMDLVQKYSGRDGTIPHLSKLGTKAWEKLKGRTKENIKEIAIQLIKLYATRKMKKGFAFSKDSIWQKELEASFEFEETIDQLSAINNIKDDMESSRPMDRLVCGDVGFGKTEVAVRAAFKAINDGKQAAVLVPTTILAQQHFETFHGRLKQFPVNIELLSRFKTPAQQKDIIKMLAAGEIDLIVGTHRILSKDIKFNSLGLLVVDEEHRFGVLHKEKIKLLKTTVDTLSLSATPIPRTMHMALMGAKDMSIINTPPHNRLPIKTEVSRFDRDFIREIILKEIDRNGQVFFVHNRVQSIYGIANLLRQIVPEVTIAVAHGQMKAHTLENVMQKFAQQKIQCLVCTMIIESGIDLPNVNTLIINRADKFGLAQLYQLRGRVGRSDLQAYAYLLIPPLRKLTRTAIKRLQTIQEMSLLGSGYKIAMRDLEIRGTGNIFGPQQSGFVDALGYDLYTKIINEAVLELKKELKTGPVEKEETVKIESKIDVKVDAYLPDDYITNPSERVDLYRRLIEAKKTEQVEDLKNELLDRFGPLPEKAQILIDYVQLKLLAQKALVSKLTLTDTKIVGQFAHEFLPAGEQFKAWFGKIVQNVTQKFELKQQDKELFFEIKLKHSQEQISTAKNFLQSII
ncbi:transcription-repair coupling factor [candidate division KSB1 bacterium]|nr:transcription-repair coupling factor [candidate division KSB1 bacterium]